MEKIKLNIQMFAGATIDGYSTASNCDCQIVWSSTLDPDKNTSSVTASIQVRKNGSGSTQGTFSGNITIDGTAYSVSKYTTWSWGTWHTVGSATKTVTHNENGTKSINIRGTLTQTGTSMAGTYTAGSTSTSIALDTNNRASILGDIDDFGINDTVDIPITKYVAGYTDSLVITYGATTIKTITSITNGYDLTFSAGEQTTISGLMTSPSIELTFTLSTYDGATYIGSSSVKTAKITSLSQPTLYNIVKKTNGYYQLAINGIVDDNDTSTLQVYDDSGKKTFLSNLGLYSTDEQAIGTWIDGKTIYRKVFYVSSISFTSATYTLSTGINNLDSIIDLKYAMYYSSSSRWYTNWDGIDRNNWTINGTNLQIVSTGTAAFTKVHFIVEYTKTS